MCTYVIREVVENYASNGYADQINFHFLPVTNPDGYDYTFTDVSEKLAAKLYRAGSRYLLGQSLLQNVPISSLSRAEYQIILKRPLTQ